MYLPLVYAMYTQYTLTTVVVVQVNEGSEDCNQKKKVDRQSDLLVNEQAARTKKAKGLL